MKTRVRKVKTLLVAMCFSMVLGIGTCFADGQFDYLNENKDWGIFKGLKPIFEYFGSSTFNVICGFVTIAAAICFLLGLYYACLSKNEMKKSLGIGLIVGSVVLIILSSSLPALLNAVGSTDITEGLTPTPTP